jgi:DnaJ-class molecular chaperone
MTADIKEILERLETIGKRLENVEGLCQLALERAAYTELLLSAQECDRCNGTGETLLGEGLEKFAIQCGSCRGLGVLDRNGAAPLCRRDYWEKAEKK